MAKTVQASSTECVASNCLEAAAALIAEARAMINRALDQAEDRIYHELAVEEAEDDLAQE